MDKKLESYLRYLKLFNLLEHWDEYLDEADSKSWPSRKLLKHVLKKEYEFKSERARLSRLGRGRIPIHYALETYPFKKQPHLNRKRLLSNYDSLNYIHENRNLVLIGPTGAGKTGLATSFLIHAIDEGYNGRFVLFAELVEELWASKADHTSKKVINKYAAYNCLVIDELGYLSVESSHVGLFFTLMQKRHKKACTIITTNLGFKEWGDFLSNKQLAAALIDRLTDNGHVLNMKKCRSIRKDADVD